MEEKENDKLKEIVTEAIQGKLEKARMDGIQIGWYTCCLRMYENTKDLHSVKAVRQYLKKCADEAQGRLNLPDVGKSKE